MISALVVGADQARARIEAIPDAVTSGLARTIANLGIELRSRVQDKLSGLSLEPRSGKLRSSIDLDLEAASATLTATVSTNLGYARAQEFGFEGVVSVRASLRRIREAFGRPVAEKIIAVRAYRRRLNSPARSFLGSALDDMTPEIAAEVDAAVRRAMSP
ncbi:MAG: hypothetical protein ACREFH_04850 [Stellaceae bacterium]